MTITQNVKDRFNKFYARAEMQNFARMYQPRILRFKTFVRLKFSNFIARAAVI